MMIYRTQTNLPRVEMDFGSPREVRLWIPNLPPRLHLKTHPAAQASQAHQREIWHKVIGEALRDVHTEPFNRATVIIMPHQHRPMDPTNYDPTPVLSSLDEHFLRGALKFVPDALQTFQLIQNDGCGDIAVILGARAIPKGEEPCTLIVIREGLPNILTDL